MASPNDIRNGVVIKMHGALWKVVNFERVQPGKGSSFVRTKMRNLANGKVSNETFKSSTDLEFVDVQYKKMQYLYKEDNLYTFMDTVSYEQVSVSEKKVGEIDKYLKEGLEVTVVMHGDKPISVEVPKKVQYTVGMAPPAVKGDTASGNVTKEAEMKNGLKVDVPIFIEIDDEILVNTETGEYTERVNN
jgi:elongation factor P